ncbi:tyrosine-type recombinase/integrase [Prescottella equi]|uniref:site-specific integrase n=1 Tax=Rhodococcus hoagii TaxID=43767 RepID=UPI001585A94B|nr:tyrosine-type recombinase/integrase [Prescottella equi]
MHGVESSRYGPGGLVVTKARRGAGEGGISQYMTARGARYAIRYYAPNDAGKPRRVQRRGFLTRKEAQKALRKALGQIEDRTYVAPSKLTVAEYLEDWLASLRLAPGTAANYRRNIRLHLTPHVGDVRLADLTGARLSRLYRQLETDGFKRGSKAGRQGLSARTVRYVHTIVKKALKDAVEDGLLVVNPAERAKPPSARQARAGEMQVWTPAQARAFLAWARENRDDWREWHVLLHTGMRRGELIGLRWSDVDLSRALITIARSVGVLIEGGQRRMHIGPTKTDKPRVVNLDAGTVDVLRQMRKERGELGLEALRPNAYVFAHLGTGGHQDPDTLSARFDRHVVAAGGSLGEDVVPRIRLHDLRHTHATALLGDGVPVKVVSERLGHTDVMTTLRTYQHVLPGMQADAANAFAALLG